MRKLYIGQPFSLCMAFAHHLDISHQFEQQQAVTQAYIIPFLAPHFRPGPGMQVLDVGCGVGGVLAPFVAAGCTCTGVDVDTASIEVGKQLHADLIAAGSLALYRQDIYDWDTEQRFDLILLKDSIEHIADQARIIGHLKTFLKPGGFIFFGFPPWVMPFGGHQQVIRRSALLSKLPWYHLLPMPLYRAVLRAGGVEPGNQDFLIETKERGISSWRFQRILKRTGYRIVKRTFWLFNPIYQYKFGLKGRKQFGPIAHLPGLRDLISTAVYYLVQPTQ
ncbi:MAG: class I SAM-dependent methyltransferase [Sphingobacteriia bacterium]